MKKQSIYFLVIIILLVQTSCQQNNEEEDFFNNQITLLENNLDYIFLKLIQPRSLILITQKKQLISYWFH